MIKDGRSKATIKERERDVKTMIKDGERSGKNDDKRQRERR